MLGLDWVLAEIAIDALRGEAGWVRGEIPIECLFDYPWAEIPLSDLLAMDIAFTDFAWGVKPDIALTDLPIYDFGLKDLDGFKDIGFDCLLDDLTS